MLSLRYFFRRVVGRVDVRKLERTDRMYLDDGVTPRDREVMRVGGSSRKSTGLERRRALRRELVAHADQEVAAEYRDVFVGRMIVRGDLVSARHVQSHCE